MKDQKIKGYFKASQDVFEVTGEEEAYDEAILPLSDRLSDIGISIDESGETSVEVADTRALHFWAEVAPTLIGLSLIHI